MVLRHLSIDCHSRPVELPGGLSNIPIGGVEGRKQRVLHVLGKAFGIPEPPAELPGQVYEGQVFIIRNHMKNSGKINMLQRQKATLGTRRNSIAL